MVLRSRRPVALFVACASTLGAAAMSQEHLDPVFRSHLDSHFPFIEQNAEPPGQWRPNESRPGQSWSGVRGWRTRHGAAVVMWAYGKPIRVWNATLPDGMYVEAAPSMGSESWRYRVSATPRRWVHGRIDIAPDRVTFAPGEQPHYLVTTSSEYPDLEADLASDAGLRARLVDEEFADSFYAYLKNGEFWKEGGERIWSIGLASAADLVANLRGFGDTYIDYYPNGGRPPLSGEVLQARKRLGKPDLTPEEVAREAILTARFDEITQRLAALGWRRATKADKVVAAAATRHDLASWELRPEASRAKWAIKYGEPVPLQGIRLRPKSAAPMTEEEHLRDEEVRGQLLEKRLHALAVSGRISEAEFRSMSAVRPLPVLDNMTIVRCNCGKKSTCAPKPEISPP